jgi:BirA family biotin operon repressor/biotin-[acetyl-CoA-carboxylase] ligase
MAMALGVYHFAKIYTTSVTVKWPNDIYLESKKCAGLLIENGIGGSMLKRATVGIGININQTHFESDKATSLAAMTGQRFDLSLLLCPLLQSIEKYYLMLRHCSFEEIKEQYLQVLLGYRTPRLFKDQQGKFQGAIVDITPAGMLVIERENLGLVSYGLKEIEWL